jgi:hypothetical protein
MTAAHASPEETPVTDTLPALATPAGGLDLDALRGLSGTVKIALIDALRHSVAELRAARGTVVAEEDTYDVVRRLTDAGEVLRRIAEAFTAAAREADALIEEEALTVHGEDGVGKRIAVRADWAPGKDAWDTGSLVGWLVDDEVADYSAASAGDPPLDEETRGHCAAVGRAVAERLLALGRFTPSVTAVKALRTRMAERGRDADAAVLGQLRQTGDRVYKGVKITREDTPGTQR